MSRIVPHETHVDGPVGNIQRGRGWDFFPSLSVTDAKGEMAFWRVLGAHAPHGTRGGELEFKESIQTNSIRAVEPFSTFGEKSSVMNFLGHKFLTVNLPSSAYQVEICYVQWLGRGVWWRSSRARGKN